MTSSVTERLSQIEANIRKNIDNTKNGDLIKAPSFVDNADHSGIEEEDAKRTFATALTQV